MKTLYLLGACALLSTTLFSCTADEDTTENKAATEVKKAVSPTLPSYADGPDDDPIKVPPPPTKD
ncbi:hypothetical protein IR010_12635 [Flavobacterium sp. MR2016-29]|uniref:hypothetical protein n=1 Tax=Flavobacterium sp. MR2016-29 TaxID=2783795 RepID=UPI00188BE792|nr:hypothetical protein [Flavobacterium sp. MR2016-29]MBF4493388.1 hypothetical protein [Flavobacterium sp. MR2016-29]